MPSEIARRRFKNEHRLKEMRIEEDDVDRMVAFLHKMPKAHPYCTPAMLDKIMRQQEAYKKAGVDFYDPEVARRIQRGAYKLPHPDFDAIWNKTWCDVCGRRAERIEIGMYHWNRWYKFNIWCHGQQESYEVTEIEYELMMQDLKRAYVFLDPVKQEAREWVDIVMAAEPPHKLLPQFAVLRKEEETFPLDRNGLHRIPHPSLQLKEIQEAVAGNKRLFCGVDLAKADGRVVVGVRPTKWLHVNWDADLSGVDLSGGPVFDEMDFFTLYSHKKQRWWRRLWERIRGRK